MRLLAALNDAHLSRVLGVCTASEPFCVVLEYLDFGDLHQFLQGHRQFHQQQLLMHKCSVAADDCLSMGSLIFIAGQIASGMRYLESLNFVHRDLAARFAPITFYYLAASRYQPYLWALDASSAISWHWMQPAPSLGIGCNQRHLLALDASSAISWYWMQPAPSLGVTCDQRHLWA